MQHLLTGMLTFAQAGRSAETVGATTAGQLVHEASLGVEAADVKLMTPDLSLETQVVRLQQVLNNVVSNGVQHSERDDPVIEGSIENRDGVLCIVVEDNGPGIPAENRERIFRAFSTLKSRDVFESTGMGLALVQKLVHSQGGTVEVSDSPRLKGARFQISWPLQSSFLVVPSIVPLDVNP